MGNRAILYPQISRKAGGYAARNGMLACEGSVYDTSVVLCQYAPRGFSLP